MKESIEYKLNNFMNKIVNWCNNVGLQIATDKTEIIILTGMRIPKVINVNIGNKTIITSKNIKDLDIIIDNARRYTTHMEAIYGKADALVAAIRCLLPNIPLQVNATSPVCAGALKVTNNKKILKKAQRTALIHTSTAYRIFMRLSCNSVCLYILKRKYGQRCKRLIKDIRGAATGQPDWHTDTRWTSSTCGELSARRPMMMLLATPGPLPFALGMAILEFLAGKNWALRLCRLGGRTRGAYESFLYIGKKKKRKKEQEKVQRCKAISWAS